MESEDTGAYGIDIGTNIAELFIKVLEVIPENVILRFGLTNPPYIKNHLKKIELILNHPQVYSHLHICA